MNKIKKTILTLALLLTAVGGAWAQGADYDIDVHFDPSYNPDQTHFNCMIMGPGEIKGTLNLSVDGVSKGSFNVNGEMVDGEIPAIDAGDHTYSAVFYPVGGGSFSKNGNFSIDQCFAYVYIDDPGQSSIEMGVGESRNFWGHVDGPELSEVNISSSNDNVAKFRASSIFSSIFEGYIDAVGAGTATITVSFAGNKNYKAAESKTITVTVLAPEPTVEVAWTAASKTGTFTMPGGNVELEPEYYPQAALTAQPTAINDVPATTDGAIVKAGTVANIGSTTTAQGTVMYYVSTTALDDAALLALAADAWTADVPTAESLAQGQAYVYYYVRGNDSDTDEENFSDGDIKAANALTVTIAAAPTYAVTFADDLAEPTLWTASPNTGVTKGQTVTVTYSGTKKVLGVKAEKKAPTTYPVALSEVTADYLGSVVTTDGNVYATVSAATTAGKTAAAMIAYVGSGTDHSTYTHGLAIALADESDTKKWADAKTVCSDKNTSLAVSGAAWLLPSQNQWKAMFNANGGNEGSYTGLNSAITTAGGTALQESVGYWSSTEGGSSLAWRVDLGGGDANWLLSGEGSLNLRRVRACLAF